MAALPTTSAPPAPRAGDVGPPGSPGSPGRADRAAKSVLLALALAFVLAVAAGDGLGETGASGSRLGGDYPAFHAAGAIVLAGDIDVLYDTERQQEEQEGLGVDGYLAFAYPPHVAIAYAPLAAVGFRFGYALHTLLMVGALAVSVGLLRSPVPALSKVMWPAVAAAVCFYPLFRAVGGGQNTALTVLAFAVVWRMLHEDRDALAGLAAGLLLYRPQYALPLIGLLGIDRRWRAVAAAGAVGAVTWVATAAVMGWSWFGRWIDQVLPFVERDAEVNSANSISLLGFGQALLGADHPAALALGGLGAVTIAVALIWTWWPDRAVPLAARMGTLAAGVLLLSPHTMFYDAGLLVIAAVAALALIPPERHGLVAMALAASWMLGLVHLLNDVLGATPLALVVGAGFVAMVRIGATVRLGPREGPRRGLVDA